jgi:hypothetical protein
MGPEILILSGLGAKALAKIQDETFKLCLDFG